MKKEENIIEYILRTQEYFRHRKFERKKYKCRTENVDAYIFLCSICNCLWSNVESYINTRKWLKYSEQIMPKIGKKKKDCPGCLNIKVQKK